MWRTKQKPPLTVVVMSCWTGVRPNIFWSVQTLIVTCCQKKTTDKKFWRQFSTFFIETKIQCFSDSFTRISCKSYFLKNRDAVTSYAGIKVKGFFRNACSIFSSFLEFNLSIVCTCMHILSLIKKRFFCWFITIVIAKVHIIHVTANSRLLFITIHPHVLFCF